MVERFIEWPANVRKEEKELKPAGFYALKSTTGKHWNIYYRLAANYRSELIQHSLTEEMAKSKAEQLNSILNTK